jgi:hypothetical protein
VGDVNKMESYSPTNKHHAAVGSWTEDVKLFFEYFAAITLQVILSVLCVGIPVAWIIVHFIRKFW